MFAWTSTLNSILPVEGLLKHPPLAPRAGASNVVARPQIFCNQVDQLPTLGVAPSSGIKGVNVAAGFETATGKQVLQLRVENNLIAGVVSDGPFSPTWAMVRRKIR